MEECMAQKDQTVYSWMARNWRELIKPTTVRLDDDTRSAVYGKFTCEPLERGFGITLGNSLRRVMLSSLQGASITAVKIQNVLHEFSTVPNVVEDVAEIILNLKGVIIKKPNPKPVVLSLDVKGPHVVTASDIGLVDNIEIVNPNHYICTVSEGGRLRMELSVRSGRGYIPADVHKDDVLGVGSIPVDALYSPIVKVNYTVTNARVGQRTDYDKLTMEIWTNGTVEPKDALAYAAKILKEHLQIFISFDEQDEPSEASGAGPDSEINQYLFRSVDELELSCVRRTACRMQTSNISDNWCRRQSPKCSRPRTLVANP